MSRRTRLILLITLGTIVVLVVAAMVALHVLLQPQRVTDMLRKQASQAGLQLTLSSPAEPTLWPRPALVLRGLTLSVDNRPVLVAARGRLVLPWDTLLGGPPAITRLELDAPQINLAQLGPVLANMDHESSATPSLLRINTGILISHGSLVRGGKTLLDEVQLETGPLAPGKAFHLQLDAHTALDQPLHLRLRMTPNQRGNNVVLNNIHITIDMSPQLTTDLKGKATWLGNGNFRMRLAGTLVHGSKHRYDISLGLMPPARGAPLHVLVGIHGEGVSAQLKLPPAGLTDWWGQISAPDAHGGLPLPPVDGTVQAEHLDLGTVQIDGLKLTTGTPAAASTVPASASSTARP